MGEVMKRKRGWRLRAYLAKKEHSDRELRSFIKKDILTNSFSVNYADLDGEVFTEKRNEKKPEWVNYLNILTAQEIDGLINKSNAAVFMMRVKGRVLAFPFGYGRSMLEERYFEGDFGLKTALNSLDRESLR